MDMLGAVKQPNGKYSIKDRWNTPRFATTYYKRNKLKEFGGKWNPEERCWTDIDEKYLKDLLAIKQVKVKIAPYGGCSEESYRCVYEDEIINNMVQVLNWADDREWVKVIENLGEI